MNVKGIPPYRDSLVAIQPCDRAERQPARRQQRSGHRDPRRDQPRSDRRRAWVDARTLTGVYLHVARITASGLANACRIVSSTPSLALAPAGGGKRVHEAQLLQEEEGVQLARTMLALQRGQEVDQVEWDRAAELYDTLSGKVPSDNRRNRAR